MASLLFDLRRTVSVFCQKDRLAHESPTRPQCAAISRSRHTPATQGLPHSHVGFPGPSQPTWKDVAGLS